MLAALMPSNALNNRASWLLPTAAGVHQRPESGPPRLRLGPRRDGNAAAATLLLLLHRRRHAPAGSSAALPPPPTRPCCSSATTTTPLLLLRSSVKALSNEGVRHAAIRIQNLKA